MKKIEEYLYDLESSENPLSADVYFILGNNKTYIFDVGANINSLNEIKKYHNREIIISHFHQDHIYNLNNLDDKNNIYVSSYTFKHLNYGKIVNDLIEINDGVNLKIFEIPNSHAKGSLALIINDKYLLLGDSIGSNIKGYNVSLLYDEIKSLEEYKYEYVLLSHKNKIYKKDAVIIFLKNIYNKKEKGNPYIGIYE